MEAWNGGSEVELVCERQHRQKGRRNRERVMEGRSWSKALGENAARCTEAPAPYLTLLARGPVVDPATNPASYQRHCNRPSSCRVSRWRKNKSLGSDKRPVPRGMIDGCRNA